MVAIKFIQQCGIISFSVGRRTSKRTIAPEASVKITADTLQSAAAERAGSVHSELKRFGQEEDDMTAATIRDTRKTRGHKHLPFSPRWNPH